MTPARMRFGPCEFDAASGELWRDGRRVRLQRQPARLLELLVTNAGRVVSREEIRRALWGEDVHVDFERSLNFCVGRLRAALEDDPASPRFVETVPTRGYRFIAQLETATPATEHTASTNRSAAKRLTTAKVVSSRIPTRAMVVALLLGAGGVTVGLYRAAVQPAPKVVVVPFHNETGSAEFDRVAKGVSDAAVARLASPDRLRHLQVIGNATDVYFSFRPRDMKAMGQALGAQYLVLGQLKKDNTHFRVIAHLIRVNDQTHVWATTFDRETLDLPTQSAIAEDIAEAVSRHLTS